MARTPIVSLAILPTSVLKFGGHVDFRTSVPLTTPQKEVLIQVQALAGGGLAGYTLTDSNGNGSFKLGPTPTWSSGAAVGSLSVVVFDSKTGTFSTEKGSIVNFTVSA